ncbi:MAG: hypothetical protein Kow0037_12760 [Calditrichia bacterium]
MSLSEGNSKVVFISWQPYCSRSDNIARKLQATSYKIYIEKLGSNYFTVWLKYLLQSLQTLWLLFRKRPKLVLVMTPPVFACFPVWFYCRLFNASFAIDAHTGVFTNPIWEPVRFLNRFFSKRAKTTIVTNKYLHDLVVSWGAQATIISDVPVKFGPEKERKLSDKFNITFVCSYTYDEPLKEVLEAAQKLPDVSIYITGNYKSADPELIASKPENVHFTGFLSDEEYVGQLKSSDAVMALTTVDHTMQRGAYEAVYLKRPVITSDFGLLRDTFYKGTVHVKPTVAGIVKGIQEMKQNHDKYLSEVEALCREKLENWAGLEAELRKFLELDSSYNENK